MPTYGLLITVFTLSMFRFGSSFTLVDYNLTLLTGDDGTSDPFFVRLGEDYSVTGWFHREITNGSVTKLFLIDKPELDTICSLTITMNGLDSWNILSVSVENYWKEASTFAINRTFGVHLNVTEFTSYRKVNGAWSSWSRWSNCVAIACGSGTQRRLRLCNKPQPSCGGSNCISNWQEFRQCVKKCIFKNSTTTSHTAINFSRTYVSKHSTTKDPISSPESSSNVKGPREGLILGIGTGLGIFCVVIICLIVILAFRKNRSRDQDRLVRKDDNRKMPFHKSQVHENSLTSREVEFPEQSSDNDQTLDIQSTQNPSFDHITEKPHDRRCSFETEENGRGKHENRAFVEENQLSTAEKYEPNEITTEL